MEVLFVLAGTCAPRPGRKPAPSVFLCPATSTESNSALVLFPKLCDLTQTRCWALGQSALGCSGVFQSHEHHMHQLQIISIMQALCSTATASADSKLELWLTGSPTSPCLSSQRQMFVEQGGT